MKETRKRGFSIKPEGLTLIEKTMKEKGYSRQQLADAVAELEGYLSIDTINRLLRGEKTQRKTIEAIAKALDLKPTDLVEPSEWYPASSTSEPEKSAASEIDIDWREVCCAMLEKQQESQRLRRKATEMGFEVNVHVPLGLVERKQQQRRDGNIEPNQLYQLDREVIAKTYQHDEFLTEVIGQRQTRKNKNIAIVGEPGAGKTTLLGAIASFIQSNTEDLPICITLASLQERTLEDYLLKTWLPEALGLANSEVVLTPAIENELIKQFRKGGVWLLLDGVDEMGADSPVQALATIQKQLTDWLGQARIVLTCRLNVWDASINNTLTGFDTYKTQEFTQEQVDQFIQDWFTCAEDVQRGKQLQANIKETARERICDLVKHPLRLALLCQTFYLDKQAELPETKALLYERFTRYFYEWKQSIHPEDLINRNELKDELHQALGKLAQADINNTARFRLSQSLVCQTMGEQLFKLACDLGWLNLVERDAKTDESVYAFFHPTFQEYFAALAVDDWDYFLPREHDNHNPKAVRDTYRIFEPQWKEVILLWLGRKDVAEEQKETFIKALIEYKDGCGSENFYGYQAYLLAATGIAEFKKCSLADKIVKQIVNWTFSSFNWKEPQEQTLSLIAKVTKEILPRSERNVLIKQLLNLINILCANQDNKSLEIALEILGKVGTASSDVKNALFDFIHSEDKISNRIKAVESLIEIKADVSEVAEELNNLLHFRVDESERWSFLEMLNEILNANQEAILQFSIDESERLRLLNEQNNFINSLKKQCDVEPLPYRLKSVDRVRLAAVLLKIAPDNKEAIKALKEIFDNEYSTAELRLQAAEHLNVSYLEDNKEFLIRSLYDKDIDIAFKAATILKKNSLDYTIELLGNTLWFNNDEQACSNAAYILIKIDPGNLEAIDTFTKLLESSNDSIAENAARCLIMAASDLLTIDPNNKQAIDTLTKLLNFDEIDIRFDAANELITVDPDNKQALDTLNNLLQNSQGEYIPYFVLRAIRKRKIQLDNLFSVVADLINCLQLPPDLNDSSLSYIIERYWACCIIWHCAQNMTYPDFYRAWHGEASLIQSLENLFTNIASQLQPTDKTYPIVINAQALEGEIETSAIAQALSNRIYRFVFPDDSEIPPEVSNAYQLERSLLQLKKQLQTPNLAVILDKCEPNQALITFCRKLTDVLHIAWITNQPLEPPLKGFPREQANLLSAVQSWIDEIG